MSPFSAINNSFARKALRTGQGGLTKKRLHLRYGMTSEWASELVSKFAIVSDNSV